LWQDPNDSAGWLHYSMYKIAFIVPPLLYCKLAGVSPFRDILKFQHWRQGLSVALKLGLLAVAIFWGAYFLLSDVLLDKEHITRRIDEQFHVNASTVLLVAPFTILLNSLLEEFFYRGFVFGQLLPIHKPTAYVLPAAAFTIQHLLFIADWVTRLPFALATIGLFVFAVVASWLYARYETIVTPWVTHMLGDVAMMGIAVSLML
jgi:membrane protease YdiL (CAAX protease family)